MLFFVLCVVLLCVVLSCVVLLCVVVVLLSDVDVVAVLLLLLCVGVRSCVRVFSSLKPKKMFSFIICLIDLGPFALYSGSLYKLHKY